MARTISDEELQLKRRARRRLIGAIVLVTAMVVVLPMVLDSEPKPISQEITVQIPSPDSGAFTTKVAPLSPAPGPLSAAKPPAAAEKMAGKPATSNQSQPAAKSELPKQTTTTQRKPPAGKPSQPTARPVNEPYVVQVIALADGEKARELQSKIAASGIKSYTEVVKTAKGDVTRVRAGPYATREAAEKAQEQLKTLGLNGNITAR
jgi:DedD protein